MGKSWRGLVIVVTVACQPTVEVFNTNATSQPAPIEAPKAISYSANPVTYYRGTAISANKVTVTGGQPTIYSIVPALPSGLNFDNTSGTISGTPGAVTAPAEYTISASNSAGAVQVVLNLTVNDVGVAAVSYATTAAFYTRGETVSANQPATSGGSPTSFAISPSLPEGLSFDTVTGVISGTPIIMSLATTYTVTASNNFGPPVSTQLSITIYDIPPVLTYLGEANSYIFAIYQNGTTNPPDNSGGAITSCAFQSTPPPGLSVSNNTCEIFGIPTQTSPRTTYALSVGYFGGTTPTSVTLTVNGVLTAVPASITMTAAGASYQFSATGGVPPYVYQMVSGPGTIDPGPLSESDPSAGTYYQGTRADPAQIQIRDSGGSLVTANIQNLRIMANGPIYAIASDANSMYIGGSFSAVAPDQASSLALINGSTGAHQLPFNVGEGFGPEATIYALAVDGNSVFVGGSFTSYQGQAVSNLVKLNLADASLDTTFTSPNGFSSPVATLAVVGNWLYVVNGGGYYETSPVIGLTRINATDGMLDTTFPAANVSFPTASPPIMDPPTVIAALGNDLYGGGAGGVNGFLALQTSPPQLNHGLTAINLTTGELETAFNPPFVDANCSIAGNGALVNALSATNDTLYNFAVINTVAQGGSGPGSLYPPGLDALYAASFNGPTTAVAVGQDTVAVVGAFSQMNSNNNCCAPNTSAPAAGIAIMASDGYVTNWGTAAFSASPSLNSVAFLSDGNLVVGGSFSSYSGTAVGNIVSLNTLAGSPITIDSTFSLLGFNSPVNVVINNGGGLWIGGNFTQYQSNDDYYWTQLDQNLGVRTDQ